MEAPERARKLLTRSTISGVKTMVTSLQALKQAHAGSESTS